MRERDNILTQLRHRQERLDAIDASLLLARARLVTKAQRAAELAGEDIGNTPAIVLRTGAQG